MNSTPRAADVQAAAPATGSSTPAQLAKSALRRLVTDKLEPTPANYARAYQQEAGGAPLPVLPDKAHKLVERLAARALDASSAADFSRAWSEQRWDAAERAAAAPDDSGVQLADLIDRVVRGVSRGGRHWTSARKKESLQRVLEGSRGDAGRLQQRLRQLLTGWDGDTVDEPVATDLSPLDELPPEPAGGVQPADLPAAEGFAAGSRISPAEQDAAATAADWPRVVDHLSLTVKAALPATEPAACDLSAALASAVQRVCSDGATAPSADSLAALCADAQRMLQHRHHLVDQLGGLCRELTDSLSDLAENDSWAQGQCEAMRLTLDDGLTARGVKSVGELLRDTRQRQTALRAERERARDALKGLINRMLSELGELGSQTGRFHESVGRYADVIDRADSLESLAGVVREMVEESRTVQALVSQTQQRLQDEHGKATELTLRVGQLEDELKRLAEEVSTDQLTQIANRRGLLQAFDAERSRMERGGGRLCIGLLDIDNFKRLNDELGHVAGDQALKSLADVVARTLRPTDLVARYGGEEFVVLLPDTPIEEGRQILTRLQRSLSGGLFMHEGKHVFVTFSAGVTTYRDDEPLERALERADQALYEAKRTGKNRTCCA